MSAGPRPLPPDERWWRDWQRRLRAATLTALFAAQCGVLTTFLGLVDLDVVQTILLGAPLGWTPEGLWARTPVRWGLFLAIGSGATVVPLALSGWTAGALAHAGGVYQWQLHRRARGGRKRARPRLVGRVAVTIEAEADGMRPETAHRWLDTFGLEDVPDEEERATLRRLERTMWEAADQARAQLRNGAERGDPTPRLIWAARPYLAEDLVILTARAAERASELRVRAPAVMERADDQWITV